MLNLEDLTAFMKVVETESFTRAGEQLNLPKSTISRRVARLEQELGTLLLQRSTRAVTVTEDGALFFEYCLRSVGLLRDGERALRSQQRHPSGIIRIAIPQALSETLLGSLFADYVKDYPDIRLLTVVSDDSIAMLRSGFDMAIATGPLPDSGLISTGLGSAECPLFCAHSLAERAGLPQSHVELTRFDLLAIGTLERRNRWLLQKGEESAVVEFGARFASNDLPMLRQATLAGLGIASLPAFLCKGDLARGDLIEVLPGWHTPSLQFHAVFDDSTGASKRVRSMIDFLVENMRGPLSWDIG